MVKRKDRVKIKFRHRHPFLFYTTNAILIAGVTAIVGAAIYTKNVLEHTPTITEYQLKSDGTSNMYDTKGELIWTSSGVKRDYVKISDVPDTYKDFLLATEHETYYQDKGFSWRALGNAFYTSARSKLVGDVEARGGSGIEQQLIKQTAFLNEDGTAEKSIDRKMKEIWLAYQLDENFSKDKILEFYINKIAMGENSYGAETISITYYDKRLKDLSEPTPENLSKLAIIAGLGQAPSTYNLYDNPKAVEKRRNEVLISAYNNGKLTKKQVRETRKVPVTDGLKERFWRNNEVQARVGKYNAYINSTLTQVKTLGYDLNRTPLQIYTHLDTSQQEWLTSTINNFDGYRDGGQQIAVTVMEPKTGIVLAQSGGRNETANGLNRATQMSRSSGSSLKPFTSYGPAIEYLGYGSNYVLSSAPYQYPGTNVVADNYGGYTYGNVKMSYALQMSLNTTTNRLMDEHLGSSYVKNFVSKFNMDVKDTYGGSDALGLDMSTERIAAAFAMLANDGKYNAPQYISKLKFSDGSERNIKGENNQAIKQSTAFILNKMLEGTTRPNMSAKDAAMNYKGHIVKTGTVGYDMASGVWHPDMSASDAWVNGATKSVAVSIWTGYDTPNQTGHEILENDKSKYTLYKLIQDHYNQGKDTSDWSAPQTVTALGGGEYAPNGVKFEEIPEPTYAAPLDISSIMNAKDAFDNQEVKQETKDAGVPKGYVNGKWEKDLKGESKTIHDYWTSHNGELPTIADILDKDTANFSQSDLTP